MNVDRDRSRKRADMLIGRLARSWSQMVVMRWSVVSRSCRRRRDVGIVIGAALVALYFVMSDARASKSRRKQEPSAGVQLNVRSPSRRKPARELRVHA